ncbi:MAG: T9SS type A sorting domain-containing protein [Calditrichaeota bacterium]|nr:T9SS type A sorting domain-containing protein [Calditrichota bacterium]
MSKNLLFILLFLLRALGAPAVAQVHVTLPDTAVGADTDLIVPIIVDTLDPYNVISLDFTLVYDSNLLTANDTLLANALVKQFMLMQTNLSKADTVSFAGFGIFPITGGDTLIKILFHSTSNSGLCPLTFASIRFNEGDPTAIISDGIVRVNLAPIPVELSSFQCETRGHKIYLNWTTLSEKNNYGFSVQRAICQNLISEPDINSWKKISFVPGHGTTADRHDYEFRDDAENFSNCFLYYRLKQIDVDGSFKFSPIRQIHLLPRRFSLAQNFPNPFNSATKVKFTTPFSGTASVHVYNVRGQKIFTLIDRKTMPAGSHEFSIDMNSYPAGVYFYEINFVGERNFHQTNKMIYLK